MNAEDVLKNLKTSNKGLSNTEAKSRLKEYGLNKLKSKKRKTALIIFLEQFKSFLVILLLFAVLISIFLGLYIDAIVIGIILILNALLGFYQEYKAERAVEALKKLIVSKVIVLRDNVPIEIPTEELVPGDVVLLETGNKVPADVRLIESINLRVDESALTGESVPVGKDTKILKEVPIHERKNMAFMGTLVNYGRGKGVVVSTGHSTEIGKIAGMIQEREEPTPLQIKLQHFGKQIGLVVIIITLILFVLGILKEEEPFIMFMTAMSLAISAVPEGLPAVITLTLALGIQRMSKRNSVIKRLGAAEALGSTTVIAADKTGTMTTNEMTARKIWCSGKTINVTGVGFEPEGEFLLNKRKIDPKKEGSLDLLIRISSLCNDSILKKGQKWRVIGDPTEGALEVLAKKAGFDKEYPRFDEIPFSSERKMMTTMHKIDNEIYAYSKGAPEIVLKKCDRIYINKKITDRDKDEILTSVKKMAKNGLRVLGFSYKKLSRNYSIDSVEKNMTFVGLVGMIDPPRKETKKAVEMCKRAGIKTIMVTGDHQLTAQAIAAEIGLKGMTLTGEELDKINDKKLESIIDNIAVFARVSPQHKLRIVKTLKRKGNIVAVTGDGVNDAPALKRADIGVAMGIKGTDVAKEAADMVLMDDNFYTIVSAVEEGRGIFDNIKKFIKFLLAANFDEVFIVTAAVLLSIKDPATGSLVIPFLPIQILWLNLITDGLPALALGVDPKEKDIMGRKPRDPKKGILDGILLFIIVAAIIAFITSFVLFNHILNTTPNKEIALDKARTMLFTQTMLFEFFLVFNCRSEKKSAFRLNPLENKKLIIAIAISLFLQVVIIYTPMLQGIFGVVPLEFMDWLTIIIFSAVGLLVVPEILIRK